MKKEGHVTRHKLSYHFIRERRLMTEGTFLNTARRRNSRYVLTTGTPRYSASFAALGGISKYITCVTPHRVYTELTTPLHFSPARQKLGERENMPRPIYMYSHNPSHCAIHIRTHVHNSSLSLSFTLRELFSCSQLTFNSLLRRLCYS